MVLSVKWVKELNTGIGGWGGEGGFHVLFSLVSAPLFNTYCITTSMYNNNHLAYRIDVFTLSVCLKCCLAYLSISFDSFVEIIVLKMLMPSVLTSTNHIHWIPEIVGEPVVSRIPFSRGRVITQRNGKRRIY